jgi:hypothetical protein
MGERAAKDSARSGNPSRHAWFSRGKRTGEKEVSLGLGLGLGPIGQTNDAGFDGRAKTSKEVCLTKLRSEETEQLRSF